MNISQKLSNSAGLAIVFFILSISILIRVKAEATHYMSPDSHFYLKVASNILEGKGMIGPVTYPFDNTTPQSFFSIWPIGYPSLIAFFGLIFPNLLWASKAANLFFLGASFILLHLQYKESALWASFAYLSYGLTEVYSYTWSEGPFLFFVLLLFYGLSIEKTSINVILTTLSLSSLFLIRYSGVFFWTFMLIYLAYLIWKKQYGLSKSLSFSLILSGLVILSYLSFNYLLTGYITGANRVYIGLESWGEFSFYLTRGVINIFAFARNVWFVGSKDLLALVLLFFQVIIMIYVGRGTIYKLDPNQKLLIFSALFYLAAVILIRSISPFDTFNYRIFSPVSLIFFIVFFQNIHLNTIKNIRKRNIVITFILISYLINLPVYYLINKTNLILN